MRLVNILKRIHHPYVAAKDGVKAKASYWEKVVIGQGIFHQFGSDFEDFGEQGAGNFSTAIVELSDGSVENIDAQLIQFLTPLGETNDG